MGVQQKWSVEEAVQSYALWWREAGLHTAIEEDAHGWLQALPPVTPPDRAPEPAPEPVTRAAPPALPSERHVAAPVPLAAPDALPAFLDWLANDAAQPEAAWDGPHILPPAQTGVRLLVIVEMPAAGASDADNFIDPVQRRFVDAMLASLGLAAADVAMVPLATRRPPGGLIDEATLDWLAARMIHYLGLARPGAAIILGDRPSRALIGPHNRPPGAHLPMINHRSGTMAAMPLPGLDMLMGRPAAKARSWQTLRLLHGILHA